MNRFIQLHTLISYPPANLNRDDQGRPKTAKMGGVERLRVSSQSLKRAWRTSDLFVQQLAGKIGVRTKLLGKEHVYNPMTAAGISEKNASDWASKIAAVYGTVKRDKPLEIEQLVHVSQTELLQLDQLVAVLIAEKRAATDDELASLLQAQQAVDIAMFGRMLAGKTQYNGEAAVQVAHALGVHASVIEDDYFTAVDDLNKEVPTAHIDELGFASAVFYQYICIDRELLKSNLAGNEELTQQSIKALIEAALTVGPSGKQNSFASRAYAHYALLEKGDRQPRSLSLAFLNAVKGESYATDATRALLQVRDNMDKVYGPCAAERNEFDVIAGTGSLQELVLFAAE